MIKRLLKAIKRILKNVKYLKYLRLPVDNKAFLLEAGQGKHINGNIFAFLKVLEKNEEYAGYTPYLVIEKGVRKEAEKKLQKYGFAKTKFIVRETEEYLKILATAKYLVTDNSFPYYFYKRDEQVYLNTWHGTPLKRLGRADIDNSTSIGNVQKNFLTADYLLFPNEYTKDIMMSDYMIDRLYSGKAVTIDYPRNDALFESELRDEIISKYGLEGKRILAYMPTWRGTGRNVNIKKQLDEAVKMLSEIDASLGEDELLYVNFHFLLGNKLDFSNFKNVRKFPAEYETYDFLNVCDTLISDYSSVMLDFAQTGKNVLMYIYDYEEYSKEKGFYFDIKTLPFGRAENIDELIKLIHAETEPYKLQDKFMGNHFGVATEKMIALLCKEDTDDIQIQKMQPCEDVDIVHFGDITSDVYAFAANKYISELSDEEKRKTVISFENPINFKAAQFLKNIDENVHYLRVIPNKLNSFKELVAAFMNCSFGKRFKTAERYYAREFRRKFSGMSSVNIHMATSDDMEMFRIAAAGDNNTVVHSLPYVFYKEYGVKFCEKPKIFTDVKSRYDEIKSYEEDHGKEFWGDGRKSRGISIRFKNIKYKVTDDVVKISCKLQTRYPGIHAVPENKIILGSDKSYECQLRNIRKSEDSKGICIVNCDFNVEFDAKEISKWNTHNDLCISVQVGKQVFTNLIYPPKFRNYFKKLVYVNEKYNVVYIFKERFIRYRITVRDHNITDRRMERIKLALAWACSLITFKHKPILLYEKDSSRYEESASILYEKMIDFGHKNVRFVLDRNYSHRDRITEKYKKYIVDRFSFKHYYNMFAAKTLVSSEAVAHALEVRNMSRLFRYFVKDGMKNYVFLQHGVMYMVSLDAEQRKFFNKTESKGKQRIVVSSKLEAQHFLDYTDYEEKDIYISGLIKFDKSIQDEDADKIVVMPTWRPWDYVQGLSDFKKTGYYRFTEEIVNSIPEGLKDKLVVLPHPLLAKQIEMDDNNCIWKYYKEYADLKYDDVLKKTKLLITDYSSISYDAFYRGANIIFYWKEKDESISNYGRNAHLMLTEELAFGDVCYDAETLNAAITKSYEEKQNENHIENYSQIVSYHDGRNAERLLEMMKSDGLV